MGNSQRSIIVFGTVAFLIIGSTLVFRSRSSAKDSRHQPLLVASGSNSLSVALDSKEYPADELPKMPQGGAAVKSKESPEQEKELPAPSILANLRRAAAVRLTGVDVGGMTQQQRVMAVHTVLDNTDTVCERKLRMGNLGDGGWEICDDADVRPKRPCVVYSVGISGDFSFDDDTASTYGCHVYSFDPSMDVASHNRSEFVHFYKIGIAGKTHVWNSWQLYTLRDIRGLLGHTDTRIDVLKIDAENAEWATLQEMSRSGELQRIKQLLVEFHLGLGPPKFDMWVEVLQMLEREGFRKFYVHKNPASPCVKKVKGVPGVRTVCYEIHYVRRPS